MGLRLIAAALLLAGLTVIFIIGFALLIVFIVFIVRTTEMVIDKINRFFDGGNNDQN